MRELAAFCSQSGCSSSSNVLCALSVAKVLPTVPAITPVAWLSDLVLPEAVRLPGWRLIAGLIATGLVGEDAKAGDCAPGLFTDAAVLEGSGLFGAAPGGDGSRGAKARAAAISACEGLCDVLPDGRVRFAKDAGAV